MKKKLLSLLTSIILVAFVLTSCGTKQTPNNSSTSSSSNKEADEIKIGAVIPITGDISTFGKSTKNGIELAVEQVNSAGGINGKKIKLIVQDDENKPEQGVAVLQRLINNDKVVGVIGSVSSKVSIPMAAVATQNKIPLISGASTNPKFTSEKGNEYAFRACFIDPFQGTVIAKFATENLKAKTAAVLYDVGNDYTVGLAEYFKAAFEKAGGKVTAYESYNNGETDFSAQLTNVKKNPPDVIVLTDYYQNVGLIAKQARQLGLKSIFLGGDGWDSPDLVKIGGEAVEGGYFCNHYSKDDTSPEVVKFINDYKAKYNEVPDALAALGYDAANMMFEAIKKAGSTDGEKIAEALKNIDLKAVTGEIKLDENRNPIKPAVMLKIENGKQVFVGKVNP